MALLFVAEDAYERNRRVFVDWLRHRSPDQDKKRLWLASHDAIENMVASWAQGVATSAGVSEILSEVKEAGNQEGNSSEPVRSSSSDQLHQYLSAVIEALRNGVVGSPEELVTELERTSMERREVSYDPLGLDQRLPEFDSKVHLSMPLSGGLAEVLGRGTRVLQAGFSIAFAELEELRAFEVAASASMAQQFGPLAPGREIESGESTLRMYDDFAYVHFGRLPKVGNQRPWFLACRIGNEEFRAEYEALMT